MRRTGFLATLALLALASGCASERPAIDRVQANALKKDFFVGQQQVDAQGNPVVDSAGNPIFEYPEFYMRGMLIDVGFGASQDGLFTSTWAAPMSRIRFEITQDYLNARLSYERIAGSDGKGNPVDGVTQLPKPTPDGQIVASYKITSHFDIKRSYNPTTGEPLNVIEENTTDRVWYEREYFRVDWSQNLQTAAYDFDMLASLGLEGIEWEPFAYTVDPNHPDAPHMDLQSGYLDVTNKAFAKPAMIDLSALGWGINQFPACMLPGEFAGGTAPNAMCDPIETTLRYSFFKVRDGDYEPIDHDGLHFAYIGAFAEAVRYGFARNYGIVDNQWFRFMNRYNIWDRSHYYDDPVNMTGPVACATYETTVLPTNDPNADANRDLDGDGTADECAMVSTKTGYGGSRCDIFKGMCTMPFQVRTAKPITWYVGGNTWDEDWFDGSNWATQEWDLALKAASQTAKLAECRMTGGQTCDDLYPMFRGQMDDTEDLIRVGREVDACHRTKGWKTECDSVVDTYVGKLASERGVGSDDMNIRGLTALLKMPSMLTLCHNPVVAGDHPLCGKEVGYEDKTPDQPGTGFIARQGDIRHNIILHIDKPQDPAMWGILNSGTDPLTGEVIAANTTIWTQVTDSRSQFFVDIIRYINGELSTADITNGQYVLDWSQAAQNGATPQTMTRDQVYDRIGAIANLTGAQLQTAMAATPTAKAKTIATNLRNEALDVVARNDVSSSVLAEVQARMRLARGTPFEAQLMNPAILQLVGQTGTLPASGVLADNASPLALNNPQFQSTLKTLKENAFAARGSCMVMDDGGPDPSSITAMAKAALRKFPKADGETGVQSKARMTALWHWMRRHFHYGVIIHEMGHTMGLRHNFVSSTAAMHFRPQYWQLRTKDGTVTDECTTAQDKAGAETCVGPRYYDPMTDTENDQFIWMWSMSSVMEYPGDNMGDTMGLGITDFAAARHFYGNVISFHVRDDVTAESPIGTALQSVMDSVAGGGLTGYRYEYPGGTPIHYAQLNKDYQLISGCYPVAAEQPSWWDPSKDGVWDPVVDGHLVSPSGFDPTNANSGNWTKCRQMPVDYAFWTQLTSPGPMQTSSQYPYAVGPSIYADPRDGTNRTRVPYHFASDNWADLGNLSVFRDDAGADAYEQAMFVMNTQENRHIFDNYRRGRTAFNVRAASGRAFSRYNEKLVGFGSGLAFLKTIYEKILVQSGIAAETYWPIILGGYEQQALAGTVAMDHLARQLGRPEDGAHYLDPTYNTGVFLSARDVDTFMTNCSDTDPVGTGCDLVIPTGSSGYLLDVGFGGHPLENALDDSKGDYSVDYTVNVGSYYDKINSIIHMSMSEDRYVSQSRGDFYDARFRANGLADLMPDGYRRLIANSLVNDRSVMAAWIATNSAGQPILKNTADPAGANGDPAYRLFPGQPLGWTSWWPLAGPQKCFPSEGRHVCFDIDGTATMGGNTVAYTAPVDPQVGWEMQKFVIAWVLAYIPANMNSNWIDMMRLYKIGPDADPTLPNRIEFQHPISGQVYVAATYGKECFFGAGAACTGGQLVQKGIAARVLEYANSLVSQAYKADPNPLYTAGFDANGRFHYLTQPDGTPIIVGDPNIVNGTTGGVMPTCDLNIDPTCTPLLVTDNHWAYALEGYKSVLDYLWSGLDTFQLREAHEIGLYP